jgi:hypothetical protein
MRLVTLSILAAALLVLPVAAHAAQYRVVSKPSNVQLQKNVLQSWKQLIRGQCDAGNKTACILSKKPTEKWESTIKQVLWGQYVEGISVGKVPATKASLRSSVNSLFDAHAGALSTTSTAARVKFADALYSAIKGKQCSVYTGGITGAFDASYQHVTIHDKKNKEIFSLYAGYSE